MQGYKLLRRDKNNRLYSPMAQVQIPFGARTCYRAVTKPMRGTGPLCVFNSQKSAEEFYYTRFGPNEPHLDAELWEVEYEPSPIDEVWDSEGNRRELGYLPSGTRLATSVRLTKLIRYCYEQRG